MAISIEHYNDRFFSSARHRKSSLCLILLNMPLPHGNPSRLAIRWLSTLHMLYLASCHFYFASLHFFTTPAPSGARQHVRLVTEEVFLSFFGPQVLSSLLAIFLMSSSLLVHSPSCSVVTWLLWAPNSTFG